MRPPEFCGILTAEFGERDEYSDIPLDEAGMFITSCSFGHSEAWESKS